jgi:hypothetical protein
MGMASDAVECSDGLDMVDVGLTSEAKLRFKVGVDSGVEIDVRVGISFGANVNVEVEV